MTPNFIAQRTLLFVLVIFQSFALANARSQEEDEEEPFLPGLIGKYESSDGTTCDRVDRTIAFDWQGAVPDRRLAEGNWRVEWRGRLRSQLNGRYQIHAYAAGRLRVALSGQTILEIHSVEPVWQSSQPLELTYDDHPLQISFDKTSDSPRVALFWSGPQFSLEPIDGRQLFHDRGTTPDSAFDRGESLVRALRCSACHDIPGEGPPLPAAALDRVAGNLERDWLIEWLSTSPAEWALPAGNLSRRMPHFSLASSETVAIADWLRDHSQPVAPIPRAPSLAKPPKAKQKKKKKDEPGPPAKTPLELGRELFHSVGCLACHAAGEFSDRGLFDGGDLTAIAAKRPADFFERWLQAPETVNRHHRMPVFELTDEERQHLAVFLQTLDRPVPVPPTGASAPDAGKRAIEKHRCFACHAVPGDIAADTPTAQRRTPLTGKSDWSRSCVGENPQNGQPHFALSAPDRQAIQSFVSQVRNSSHAIQVAGRQLLEEKNCLSCHQRDEVPGLAPRLTRLARENSELAPLVPAMTPPPLNSVGDKLSDEALRNAITGNGPPLRPYMLVRMPRFRYTDAETSALVAHFVTSDRIPDRAPRAAASITSVKDPALLEAVGRRLVTSDGFGCTSCHQVGDVLPVKASLNARGPALSLLGQRVRREWYDRWVRNPARIVPRMEMPSVQVAVRGILGDDLDDQLAAVWEVLNKPGFQPPESSPVRVLRHSGTNFEDRALVVTDVVRSGTDTFIKPVLIGLSNRHNVLIDLEAGRLASWTIGDTARQRTEGKSWYWESAGQEIHRPNQTDYEFSLLRSGAKHLPRVEGQFVTEFDVLEHAGNGLRLQHRLRFGGWEHPVQIRQSFFPLVEPNRTGFRRVVEAQGLESGDQLRLEIADSGRPGDVAFSADARAMVVIKPAPIQIKLPASSTAKFDQAGAVAAARDGQARIELEYTTELPVDQFLVVAPPPAPLQPEPLHVVPGYSVVRLPLADDIMPTALAWRPDGTMVLASLKGQVFRIRDMDRDGLGDQLDCLIDGLAAPYGLFATNEYVDVANKYSVVRLFDDDSDGQADRVVTVASGWGYTVDYHDWAVGLPRDEAGRYFLALPCQQDQRSAAAARHRGEFLRLVPRQPTADNPLLYELETISRGHRFPMGIARRRDGELFVTDNQGNYNPFNELNHVRPAAHFGFINALEKGKDAPTVTPPAINLPHPWVRSVNGICFLDTPPAMRERSAIARFGLFEGDLIGCEMDTRRLIRMTLQQVDDTIQGAAYPFSYDQPLEGPPLLGPLVCEVSPDGDLYVGGLRDSGWGGANNIGELVRLRFEPERLPCGIAELRAVRDGFNLEFTAAVDPTLAADPANYSLASYTRESTPEYGGPDLQHRTEFIRAVQVSDDGRTVTLQLNELRAGFVYELHVKKLVDGSREFFPAEAHYTVNERP